MPARFNYKPHHQRSPNLNLHHHHHHRHHYHLDHPNYLKSLYYFSFPPYLRYLLHRKNLIVNFPLNRYIINFLVFTFTLKDILMLLTS